MDQDFVTNTKIKKLEKGTIIVQEFSNCNTNKKFYEVTFFIKNSSIRIPDTQRITKSRADYLFENFEKLIEKPYLFINVSLIPML